MISFLWVRVWKSGQTLEKWQGAPSEGLENGRWPWKSCAWWLPIEAVPAVYFLVYPRGTRKAEQATAGRLWPRKSLGDWTRKAPEAAAPKPTQEAVKGAKPTHRGL